MTLTKLLRTAFATKPRRKARRCLGLEALESRWCPAGGQLDTTFNGTGRMTLPSATLTSSAMSAFQPDGKIVSAGSSSSGATIVRMNADGSLDPTFGTAGKVVLPATVGPKNSAVSLGALNCVLVQPDGKILVGLGAFTSTRTGTDRRFAAARLHANGSVDTSFGTNGYWSHNLVTGTAIESPHFLETVPGGGIIVGGQSPAANGFLGFTAIKLTASGQTDTTFGSNGARVIQVGVEGLKHRFDMAVTPAGGVIFAGTTKPTSTSNFQGYVVALTANGQFDTGVNGTGSVLMAAPAGFVNCLIHGVAMQSDNIIVAGGFVGPNGNQGIAVRLTPAGAVDATFGAAGFFYNPTFPTILRGTFQDVKVGTDGSVVLVAAASYTDAGVTRYAMQLVHVLADGVADASFGAAGNGVVTLEGTAFNSDPRIALGPDNRILVTTSREYACFTAW